MSGTTGTLRFLALFALLPSCSSSAGGGAAASDAFEPPAREADAGVSPDPSSAGGVPGAGGAAVAAAPGFGASPPGDLVGEGDAGADGGLALCDSAVLEAESAKVVSSGNLL